MNRFGAIASLCALLSVPAFAQDPCNEQFPQVLACTEVIGTDPPILKNNEGVTTYMLRASGDDEKNYWEHVFYTPSINIASVTKFRFNTKLFLNSTADIDLYITSPPFSTVDAAYEIHMGWFRALSFRTHEYPEILREARSHPDPVEYVKGQLRKYVVPVNPQIRGEYERIVGLAEQNMRAMHASYLQQKPISTAPASPNR